MSQPKHILTIVEPAPGGDSTIDMARDAVADGATATVLMVVTDRVKQDIRKAAESDGRTYGDAEATTLKQLRGQCEDRIGGVSRIVTKHGLVTSDVVQYVEPETTAIAIPTRLVTDKLVERIATYTGRPVIVAPHRVPVPA